MKKIGLVLLDSSADVTTVYSLLKLNGFELIKLNAEKNIEDLCLDGILLLSERRKNFQNICESMISIVEKCKTFIWLCIPACDKREREIFFQLGANGIIDYENKEVELIQLLKNFYALINKRKPEQEHFSKKFELSSSNLSVRIDGREIYLTRLEFRILDLLYSHKNEAVSYEEIFHTLWPNKALPSSYYRVSNIVFHLRGKLDTGMIQTVRSKGYKLVL